MVSALLFLYNTTQYFKFIKPVRFRNSNIFAKTKKLEEEEREEEEEEEEDCEGGLVKTIKKGRTTNPNPNGHRQPDEDAGPQGRQPGPRHPSHITHAFLLCHRVLHVFHCFIYFVCGLLHLVHIMLFDR